MGERKFLGAIGATAAVGSPLSGKARQLRLQEI